MTRFIIVRLIQTFIALIGIVTLVFFLVRLSGNPAELLKNPNMTPQAYEALLEKLGLNDSYWTQYLIYMKNLAQGDLGDSLLRTKTVAQMVGESLPNTLRLGIPSFVISMVLSIILGVISATKRDGWLDNGIKFVAVLGQALPGFFVAIVAMLIFAVELGWLPTAGMGTPAHYVLPVGTMVFMSLPGMMRLVRSTMLDVLDSEYIKLARIKGLSERIVIWKHAFRNALISPLTVAGMILAALIGGAVITEMIFNWPGMGRMIIESTFARDFTVVQSITIIIATMVLGMNLLVDVAYAWVDPQIRFQRS